MASLQELRRERIQKLEKLKALGIDPYPARSERNIDAANIHTRFHELEGKEVVAGGRILSIRTHGKLVFFDLKDHTGKVQLYIKEENLRTADHRAGQLAFSELHLLDASDFVEGKGIVTKTKRGEISVEVVAVRLLTKALRPLPDQWDGLADKEIRLRRRYIDTNINQEVYDRFVRRAKFWEAHREFFRQRGFLEMNIPVLEAVTGGADARPFVTHVHALDEDVYLRISQELYLKRLIGGGYPRVFEIGPRFRNEGLSAEHNPEHMAMEFYWAYADWKQGMKMVEDLFTYVMKAVYGEKTVFSIRGFTVDFSKPWSVIDFGECFQKRFGIDIYNPSLTDLIRSAQKQNFLVEQGGNNIPRLADILWKSIRKEIAGPAFLINHPKYLSPLQKPSTRDPRIVERFQPIIAGSELGNGWSELNDPIDQYHRFLEQQKLRDAGDEEAQMMDIDYVEMLEYGMPPTFGYGHSERNFWFL